MIDRMIDTFLAGTPLHALKQRGERLAALNDESIRNAERAIADRNELIDKVEELKQEIRSIWRVA